MTMKYAAICRYRYDPLDRLATCSPTEQDGIQRFYQKNRLTTEIQGQIQRAFFQTEDQLLAQHQGSNACTLLATDQQRSVLDGLDAALRQSAVYTPYGARHPQANPLQLLGFTGERADPVTGYYLLGNGYRAFNPVLMRFNSPDSLSPFGEGGLNAYAYCGGDPVNQVDPSGHTPILIKIILRSLRLMSKSSSKPVIPTAFEKTGSIKALTAKAEASSTATTSPVQTAPALTQEQTIGVAKVSKFIKKTTNDTEKLEKLIKNTTQERISARIARREKLAKRNPSRQVVPMQKEQGYSNFQKNFNAAKSDQEKLSLIQSEINPTNNSMDVLLQGFPDKLSRIMLNIRI